MSTPLMKQYAQVKSRHPGTVLLFRMGDFFETFEEDAKVTARVLGITLTKRRNGSAGEVPLAGFPHHALESYLPKLLRAGHRVAICEQLEDPKAAKGIVKRDVIEVVTPGIAYSDTVLQAKQNNYLASVALPSPLADGQTTVGFSWTDVSTGQFCVSEFPFRSLPEQIGSIRPSELLIQKRDEETIRGLLRNLYHGIYTRGEDWTFNFDFAYELLVTHFGTRSLKGFGTEEMPIGIVAAGAVMNYLRETQKANIGHIRRLVPVNVTDYMVLDSATKRNLEISAHSSGSGTGSLVSVLDRTETPMGGRLLKQWVNNPLKNVGAIRSRLDGVKELTERAKEREKITGLLSAIGDLERLNAKICTGRATPRDPGGLKDIHVGIESLSGAIAGFGSDILRSVAEGLQPLPGIVQLIESAIAPDPPATIAGGGVIREGYSTELDELRAIASSGKKWIAALQKKERENTGIPSLKIGFNNVFGYYIEVTHTHRDRVPESYIRKQTLTNAERYITPELKEYEEKVLNAEQKILSLETELFGALLRSIAEQTEAIQENARLLALLDCLVSLATVAAEFRYVRPEVDDSTDLQITGGRHPVIERYLPPGEGYTPNDTMLDTSERQIQIITGPNMSGKSSYLRQTGLIVLLAQMGSFVPAERARIGLVDRIFTRVGASDNIASGESTFLVEMHEAANILNGATERSLILLDEVGRGTSTFDGISIAWALTEYLNRNVKARTLFATHYHELNELADLYDGILNLRIDVREYGDKVIFLHKVLPGTADHSYGIQVAQMAGLPEQVTDRAKEILRNLEGAGVRPWSNGRDAEEGRTRDEGGNALPLGAEDEAGGARNHGRVTKPGKPEGEHQMALFEVKDDRIRKRLAEIEIEKLTPLEALQVLAELKKQAGT